MTFGEKLQKLRKENHWTQEQLAEQIDVSRQALSKWELDTALPDTENIIKLSKIFGLSTDYFLLEEEQEEKQIDLRKNRVFVILSSCFTGIAFSGLIALGIYASINRTYIISDAGGHSAGILETLEFSNLLWLFILCAGVFAIGIGILIYEYRIKIYNKKN